MKKDKYILNILKLILSEKKGIQNNELLEKCFSNIPKSLFKYSSFKDYSFDMIENNYLYLAPANIMDDQFDCAISIQKEQFRQYSEKKLIDECMVYIKKEIIKKCPNHIKKNFNIFFDQYFKGEEIATDKFVQLLLKKEKNIDLKDFEEALVYIDKKKKELLESEDFKNKLGQLINIIFEQKENTGICSLSEINNSQVMWQMYASNYEGYCIEYDMSSLEKNNILNLFPVNYFKDARNNPIKLLLNLIINVCLLEKNEEILYDFLSPYLRMLTTKNYEWSFQKEWRFLGKPREKIFAAPIKAIYLGKNISEENKNKIVEISANKSFSVFIQVDDYETLSLKFVEVEQV